MQRVTYLIDIKAPCQEVFNTVANLERRMQLSPLWGMNRLLEVDHNFPEPGSSYRVQVLPDQPFDLSEGTLDTQKNAVAGLSQALFLMLDRSSMESVTGLETDSAPYVQEEVKFQPEEVAPIEQEYFIGEYQPPHKLSYYSEEDCEIVVTWSFQSIPFGTRINYVEVFCDENLKDEKLIDTVQHVVRDWLFNIKRYSELRGGGGRRLVRWFLDRFYLKMRPDQRRLVLLLLYLQAIGLGTFLVAAIGWGIASLFL